MSVRQAIEILKDEMNREGIQPELGLGEDLFLYSSTLAPVVNVDLLITNKKQQILLSWRDDPHSGTGWHIPGGCIRFKETMEERIQKTAVSEIGTKVEYYKEPIQVFEIFSKNYREGLKDQRERAHFITLVFMCHIPENFQIELDKTRPGETGYMQWFDCLPDNLLAVQNCYRAKWGEIKKKIMEEKVK